MNMIINLPAISRVSMFSEDSRSGLSRTLELSSILINDHHVAALWHLIGPSASSTLLVIRQTWGTLVPVGLSIHANPEHSTVLLKNSSDKDR